MDRTVEIAKNIYWVGGSGQEGGLHCNPYLLLDGDEAVLIDPGSVLDFDYVYENVCSLVSLDKIKYVILHHQDPDFCASVPLFENKGASFTIVTHWRTQTLVKYYGIKSDYYIVNEHNHKLTLKSGRCLEFLPTPYLHFPGAITTYDRSTGTLFSSDLFGAFSYNWQLYAGDGYIEKMKTFHEHYMPSNDILRPVMEMFLGMEISRIAPQHGSVIKEKVPVYIKALRDLECGTFLTPIRKNMEGTGGYMSVCSKILQRYSSIYGRSEVLEAISELEITLDEELMITDYNYTGKVLLNLIFEHILARKGLPWLLVIEPLLQKLVREYDIDMPEVFVTRLMKAEADAAGLSEQNKLLVEINARLESSLHDAENKLIRCPVTGLYNFDFFRGYLTNEVNQIMFGSSSQNPGLILFSLDQLEDIDYNGNEEADEALRNTVYLFDSLHSGNELLFRLYGARFACFIPHTSKEEALRFAEKLRNEIAASDKFIKRITASFGVVCLDEIRSSSAYSSNPEEAFYQVAALRVRLAGRSGKNFVCGTSSQEDYREKTGRILLVDSDEINLDVMKTSLENLNYQVLTAANGDEALQMAVQYLPVLILSEIMLPKVDGFLFREELLAQSELKNIPFIFVSYLKDDDSVQRAASLGVEHYFKKPYMLSELIGVIRNKIKGDVGL